MKIDDKHESLTEDDLHIIDTLEEINVQIEQTSNILDNITETLLIDSYIYELLSLRLRYSFYLNLCKERELMAYIPVNEKAAKLRKEPFFFEKELVAPTEQIWNQRR